MNNVSISLSANTSNYVQRIREARTETDRNIIRMEQRIDKFAINAQKDLSSVNGAANMLMNTMRTMKFGGYVVGAAAAGVASATLASTIHQMGLNAATASNELTSAARQAKVSADEMITISSVLSTAGINMEKFGDISKDVFDKMGDYLTNGSGGFEDFFTVIREHSDMTIKDLQGLSSIEVFQTMYNEMSKVGASAEQMTNAFESVGNDAAKFMHLLADGGKEYNRLAEKMKRDKLVLLGSTMEEVQSLDSTMKAAANNMEVYFSERFLGMTKHLNSFGQAFSDMFSESGKQYQIKNSADIAGRGETAVTSFSTSDEVKAELERLRASKGEMHKKWAENKSTSFNGSSNAVDNLGNSFEDVRKKAALVDKTIKELEQRLSKLQAIEANKGTANITGDSDLAKMKDIEGRIKGQEKIQEDSNKRIADNQLKVSKERAAAIALSNKEERKQALAHANENAKLYEQANQRELDNIEISKSNITKLNNDKLDLERKSDKTRLDNQHTYAVTAEAKAQASYDKQVFDLKLSRDKGTTTEAEYSMRMTQINTELADTIKTINSAKTAETRNSEDQRLNSQLAFAVDGNAKLKAQYDIDLINLTRSLGSKLISTSTYNAYKTQLDQNLVNDEVALIHQTNLEKLNIQSVFATTEKEQRAIAHEQELLELNEYRNTENVTEQMYLDKKAQLKRDYELAEYEADEIRHLEGHERDLARYEENQQLLDEQLMNELITEQEYDAQSIANEHALTEAKRQLRMSDITSMEQNLSSMTANLKEGSAAQKAAFAMEKAATIARLSLGMSDAWSAVDKDPTLMTQMSKNIAKGAVVAQYGSQIAMAGAVALGQFHNGGEVDQTGSYILKQGERVVAPDTNKELKQFLKTSDTSSGAIQVDAPLVVEGDTTISEQKLLAMMVQQREQIARMVKLAQQESPSIR